MLTRSRRRHGFTLTEVVAAAVVLAVLAAVLFANVRGAVGTTSGHIGEAAAELRLLTSALIKFDTATGKGSPEKGRMPLQISHLVNPITSTSSTNCPLCRNSCGAGPGPPAQSLYTSDNRDGWAEYPGPFYFKDVAPGAGFALSIGFVRDSLIRTPATAANVISSWATLQIRIDNVSFADAQELNELVDGDNSSTTGTIRWSASPDAEGMLSSIFWTIPLGGC